MNQNYYSGENALFPKLQRITEKLRELVNHNELNSAKNNDFPHACSTNLKTNRVPGFRETAFCHLEAGVPGLSQKINDFQSTSLLFFITAVCLT